LLLRPPARYLPSTPRGAGAETIVGAAALEDFPVTMRKLSLFSAALLLVLFSLLPFANAVEGGGSGAAARGKELLPEGAKRSFVDVELKAPGELDALAAAGLDIAGVDRGRQLVGILATDDELLLLSALGFQFSLREDFDPAGLDLRADAHSDYLDPSELDQLMDQLVANYPTLAKKILLEDTLFEGQKIYAIKITKDVDAENQRPSFLLDSQHHAREVMTPEIAWDMMDTLTSSYASDPEVQRWVDNINIWIVPSVNPDGAMHVFQNDSGWRKNRHPGCAVDVNRNYPFLWGSCGGSSGSCSSGTFRGTAAGSEPETAAMIALQEQVRPFFALTYHSYGEMIMYSYGCNDPDEMRPIEGAFEEELPRHTLPLDRHVAPGRVVR